MISLPTVYLLFVYIKYINAYDCACPIKHEMHVCHGIVINLAYGTYLCSEGPLLLASMPGLPTVLSSIMFFCVEAL
jgi:hypothetical protein